MRTQRAPSSILCLAGSVAITAIAFAAPHEKPDEATAPRKAIPKVALEYKRDPAARAPREETVPAHAPEVPDEMRVVVKTTVARVAVRRGHDPEGLGAVAGENMANEAAHEWGWRQYWRAGFHRGMRGGLDDPRPATWERNEGFRYGRLDPRALAIGGEIAQDAAMEAAAGVAADRVRAQFVDLARDPRRQNGSPGAPALAGRYMPSGPWAVTPIFDEVFTVMPLASAPGLGREARAALDGWNAQPSHLAKDSGRSRFYDAAWKDSAYAFSVWRDRQRPGSYWSRYGPGERERFREAFFATFEEVFASIDLRRVYAGYRVGFADGWRYGVAVNAEWAYRQGYAAGFDEGVRAGAALSFPFLFDQAYASAYEREFQTWSHNPMPSLDDLFVADAGDDGVIEPGERILIAGDIVNYGGAPGTMEVHVTGAVLDGSNVTTVRLPARGRARMPQLGLRVADHVSVRTRSEVEVEIGADRRSVPIYVSRPLEIEEPLVESDPLHGRARVIVTVANRSRRPLRADTVISGASARDDRRDRLDIPAGGAARMEEVYEGFRPLDLIAGTPRWSASVSLAGVEHDARTIDVAPASTDLSSPDLVIYMVDMARSRQASHREVAHARSLLLDRMRADWDRAVAMDGNPYKSDFEEGSASTALGELVRVLHAERHAFASRSVFAGAGADIAALADDLPGTHPLLRKWMKRLAKRVG